MRRWTSLSMTFILAALSAARANAFTCITEPSPEAYLVAKQAETRELSADEMRIVEGDTVARIEFLLIQIERWRRGSGQKMILFPAVEGRIGLSVALSDMLRVLESGPIGEQALRALFHEHGRYAYFGYWIIFGRESAVLRRLLFKAGNGRERIVESAIPRFYRRLGDEPVNPTDKVRYWVQFIEYFAVNCAVQRLVELGEPGKEVLISMMKEVREKRDAPRSLRLQVFSACIGVLAVTADRRLLEVGLDVSDSELSKSAIERRRRRLKAGFSRPDTRITRAYFLTWQSGSLDGISPEM